MPRYRLLIEYDGTGFSGWQRQEGVPTVQQELEDALSTVVREPLTLHASGRTDAGVNASGQVAHFDSSNTLEVNEVQRAVNGLLLHTCGGKVVVLAFEATSVDFHARYDARRRQYVYLATDRPRAIEREHRWLIRSRLNWDRMNEAAQTLIGKHHFGSFCITKSTTRNRVCTVNHAAWTEQERLGDWAFTIEANRFVHGMVRAIVGTLVEVGKGRMTPGDIADIVDAEDRTAAGRAAPAHGLTLTRVHYRDGAFDDHYRSSTPEGDRRSDSRSSAT